MRGLVLLAGAVLAALLTWAPVFAGSPESRFIPIPLLMLVTVMSAMVAAALRDSDGRLVLVIAAVLLSLWLAPGPLAQTRIIVPLTTVDAVMTVPAWPGSVLWVLVFLVVILGLHAIRGLPTRVAGRSWIDWLALMLTALAVFEVGYVTLQATGIDPIWAGWRISPVPLVRSGTFGNSGVVGAFLAMAAPLAPLTIVPIVAAGLFLVGSKLAVIAALAGVVWQHRERIVLAPHWAQFFIGLWLVVPIWAAFAFHGSAGMTERMQMIGFGLEEARRAPWVGWGPGAWLWQIPLRQYETGLRGVAYTSPHGDWLGWLHNFGLIGAGTALWWLKTELRIALPSPLGGAALAVFLCTLGLSLTTLPILALPALLIWGSATASRRRDRC